MNLSRLIKELRNDLYHWWEKCYVGEENKKEFNKLVEVVGKIIKKLFYIFSKHKFAI